MARDKYRCNSLPQHGPLLAVTQRPPGLGSGVGLQPVQLLASGASQVNNSAIRAALCPTYQNPQLTSHCSCPQSRFHMPRSAGRCNSSSAQ